MKQAGTAAAAPGISVWNEAVLGENGRKICFVCTGNTCRSPMAAAVLNHLGKLKGYTAVSAGLSVHAASGMAPNAQEALRLRGIPPREGNRYDLHVSRQIDKDMLKKCDKIIGLTESHAMSLIFTYPQYASKIFAMEQNIPDPFGGNIKVYLNCLDSIIGAVSSMFSL